MLTTLRYIWRNPGRSIPLIVVVVLSIIISATVGTLIRSIIKDGYASIDWNRPFVAVYSMGEDIPQNDLEQLLTDEGVKYGIIPFVTSNLDTSSVTGSVPRRVLGIPEADLEKTLELEDWELKEGRLPEENKDEVLVTDIVAKSLEVGVGDRIGADHDLGPVPGSLEVTGILDADAQTALIPYSTLVRLKDMPTADNGYYLLYSENGEQAARELRKAVDRIIDNHPELNLEAEDYADVSKEKADGFTNLKYMGFSFNVLTAILLAVSLIFLTMVYIIQRLSEFATKYVLGWTTNRIIGSFVLEMTVTAIIGWIVGMVGYVALLEAMSPVFAEGGLIVDTAVAGVIPWTLPLPITLVGASYLIAARKLSRRNIVQIFDA